MGLPSSLLRDLSRSAQFIPFSSSQLNLACLRLPFCRINPNLARFSLGHTVKELVSRGLKSRSGSCFGWGSKPAPGSYRDRLAVSRAGARRADGRNLVRRTRNRQYVSSGFSDFFRRISQSPKLRGIEAVKMFLTAPKDCLTGLRGEPDPAF